MVFTVDASEVIRNLEILESELEERLESGHKRVTEEVIKPTLQAEMPKLTGNLRESVDSQEEGNNAFITGHDLEKTKTEDDRFSYGDIVYFGRGPITPKKAKALRFEIGGQVIFAKRVKGVPPNRFVDRALTKLPGQKGKVESVLGNELRKIRFIT